MEMIFIIQMHQKCVPCQNEGEEEEWRWDGGRRKGRGKRGRVAGEVLRGGDKGASTI